MNLIDKAKALREVIEELAEEHLSDEAAAETPALFPGWNYPATYLVGDRVRYGGILYRCLQNHTSQESWAPNRTPSLWAKILIPDPEVIPEWEQPESTNPYMKDDKVTHNGKTWESLIDNNVWEPGAVGTETLWAEVA